MKKTVKTVLILAIATTTVAFTNPVKEKREVKKSTINWLGKKVTGKHNGTINLKEGFLEMEGDNIVGGQFIIDMSSITVLDLKGDMKGKLEGHLKSDDFFGIAEHPTALLVVKNAEKKGNTFTVNGDITIKGITQPISFDLNMNGTTATTTVIIDRSKFNVRYGSGSFFDNLGDKTIYDDFQLDVTLNF